MKDPLCTCIGEHDSRTAPRCPASQPNEYREYLATAGSDPMSYQQWKARIAPHLSQRRPIHPDMKTYEFAVVIYVRQAGADMSDAYDRLEHNLSLRQGISTHKEYPIQIAEGGPATITKPAIAIMGKEVK